MGLEVAGKLIMIIGRSAVTTNDTTYPSGNAQAGSVEVPARAKGARTHITIDITATSSATAITAQLFGYLAGTDTWYFLDSLNNGGAINLALTNTDDSNNVHYGESLDHASAYDRLYVDLTSIAGTGASVTQRFWFETLHN